MKTLKLVSTPNYDWDVIYGINGEKIYEDDGINPNIVDALAEYFGCCLKHYEFTDEDEIDGETPDNFNNIKGIKG